VEIDAVETIQQIEYGAIHVVIIIVIHDLFALRRSKSTYSMHVVPFLFHLSLLNTDIVESVLCKLFMLQR